jgi:flagellar FliL protein
MADDNTPETSNSSKSIKLIAGAVLLQCAAISYLGYTVSGIPHMIQEAQGSAGVVEEVVEAFDPEFLLIGPLTVNLKGDDYGNHILFTKMLLRADDQATVDFINASRELIHNELILLLSDQKPASISSSAGKKELAINIVAQLQASFAETNPDLKFGTVLFKDFIVQ